MSWKSLKAPHLTPSFYLSITTTPFPRCTCLIQDLKGHIMKIWMLSSMWYLGRHHKNHKCRSTTHTSLINEANMGGLSLSVSLSPSSHLFSLQTILWLTHDGCFSIHSLVNMCFLSLLSKSCFYLYTYANVCT